MKFIARNIQIIGLLMLTAFIAAAAVLYFDTPATSRGERVERRSVGATSDSNAPHAPHAQRSDAARFTCPMHPEVMSDKEGSCPECGMTLASIAAPLDTHAGCAHGSAAASTGCAHHAETAPAGGGCCETPAPATAPLPSGCTRNMENVSTPPSQ